MRRAFCPRTQLAVHRRQSGRHPLLKRTSIGVLFLATAVCGWQISFNILPSFSSKAAQPDFADQAVDQFAPFPFWTAPAHAQSDVLTIEIDTASESDSAELAERYEAALQRVDEALGIWEVRRSAVPGFDQSLDLILATRRKALDAYFDVDYGEAMRLVSQALAEVESVFLQEQNHFDINLKIAAEAYETEDMVSAQEAIALALRLRPDSQQAAFWHERIEKLPELIAARQDASAARNAGRLQDEINALYRVLNLKPSDAQVKARIDSASRQLQDRKFNRAIGDGHLALTEKNLAKARQYLDKAQKLKPKHSETARLSQKIAEVELEIQVADLKIQTSLYAALDDWLSVRQTFEQILELEPQLNDAIRGRELAENMVSAQRRLDDFLARPERLSTDRIAAAAREEIAQVQPYLTLSDRMHSTVAELEAALVRWRAAVPVRVLSDGKTHIEVRGVGIIGIVTDRLVELKPGTYEFEGRRRGYRNKLVKVRVSPDSEDVTETTIICDEPT